MSPAAQCVGGAAGLLSITATRPAPCAPSPPRVHGHANLVPSRGASSRAPWPRACSVHLEPRAARARPRVRAPRALRRAWVATPLLAAALLGPQFTRHQLHGTAGRAAGGAAAARAPGGLPGGAARAPGERTGAAPGGLGPEGELDARWHRAMDTAGTWHRAMDTAQRQGAVRPEQGPQLSANVRCRQRSWPGSGDSLQPGLCL